jgi:thiamine biosynthesis lipoprotein
MGTHWSLRLVNPDYAPLAPVQALEQVFEDVIAQMSNWEADSLITRFNRSRPGTSCRRSSPMFWKRPCIGPGLSGAWTRRWALVSLWGFGPRQNPLQRTAGSCPGDEIEPC